MPDSSVPTRAGYLTLATCTVLHTFTHAYGVMLVPLYLLMVTDLHLSGVKQASFIVTIYGLTYNLGSYVAGILADRFDRKWLLGLALIGNGIAVAGMGLTRNYEMLIALGVLAGVFGTIFHPCANALIPAHFPKNPGMAIGLLGMGSGLGFFIGPQFAGWRVQHATWHFAAVSAWQRPCVELGMAGVVCAIIFLIVAREARTRGGKIIHNPDKATLPDRVLTESLVLDYSARDGVDHSPLDRRLMGRIVCLAAVLGFRDFSAIACVSLTSLYLQKAHGFDAQHAGLIVGGMMLIGIVANPMAVYLTPGRRRLPGLAAALVGGGLILATVPLWPAVAILLPLALYEMLQLGGYAISDAAMLERVTPEVRGRVVGVFLTIAGTFAALSPFAMGLWVDSLGGRAVEPAAYLLPYATLGVMMFIATASVTILARLGAVPEPASVLARV